MAGQRLHGGRGGRGIDIRPGRLRRWLRRRSTTPPPFLGIDDGVVLAVRHIAKITVVPAPDRDGMVLLTFLGADNAVLGMLHRRADEPAPAWLSDDDAAL